MRVLILLVPLTFRATLGSIDSMSTTEDFTPHGGEHGGGACTWNNYRFEAKERDVETSGGTVSYVYDSSDRPIFYTYDSNNHCKDEIYAGNRHLAIYAGGNTYFVHSDWLGTQRARTYGTWVATCTSLPFGDALNCTPSVTDSPLHFTGKQRDTESGLDNFGARYNASSMGRFMTPDWSAKPQGVPYAVLDDPQSLNLYAYVRNNPLTRTDPNGHCDVEGQHHSFFWCVAHSAGIIQTQKEKEAEKLNQQKREQASWERFHASHPNWSYAQYRLFVAMATMLPGPMEMSVAGEGAEALGGAAANANKLFHIFGKTEPNLEGLIAKFGSQEEAYKALLQATEAVVKQDGVTGVFEKTVQVAGESITVRGNVIDGVVHIGTAFK